MKEPAMLFPGQGAQEPGMGRALAERYDAARAVFEAADQALGFALSALCFEGQAEELARSDIAQPAILTVSVAALRAMEQAAGSPVRAAGAAGLSLGEYTALVAAGALAFEDAVRLVRRRGQYMQEACERNPGAMYSIIGLKDEQVEEACRKARELDGGVWPANYNCPGQLVISGHEEAARTAAELCVQAGARRTVRLKVAGAFHTELMQPAADRFIQELDEVEFSLPRFPVLSNVTAEPMRDADEIRDLLVAQLTNPVRWTGCMRWFLGSGVSQFYEIGPGRVLQGLLRRTDRSAACLSVCEPQQVEAFAERRQT